MQTNADQCMASLRQIIPQGRKRIGLLVGAGAPAGTFPPESDKALIPTVAGLTEMVMEALKTDYGKNPGRRTGRTRNPEHRNDPVAGAQLGRRHWQNERPLYFENNAI